MSNEQRPPDGDQQKQPGQQDPKKGTPPQGKLGRGLMSWVLILGVLLIFFALLNNSPSGKEVKGWQNFKVLINPDGGKLAESSPGNPMPVVVQNDRIVAMIRAHDPALNNSSEPAPVYVKIDSGQRGYYLEQLDALGVDHEASTGQSVWLQLLVTVGPFLLIVLLIWFLIARSMRGAGGGPGGMLGNFGKSKHRLSTKDASTVRFTDVAGIDEAKEEVLEIVEFLKSPKKFQRLGGRIPRGVLLVGPPGCGKTLLAKAIAGEADAPFFSIAGSDFVEMFVGVGASRVRDLFKQAKENSPCIIFLDEIDAVGRRRGGGFSSGGHDEREQTLNAILVEMDGFEQTDQVIVIAATNRADVLDPALTRPGRFDRQVQVTLPDLVGRQMILEVHAQSVKMGEDVDLERSARGTPMFSGADLAALINEAAILATLENKDFIEQADLEEARDKIRFGRARKSRKVEEQERIATAYHEAGHAAVQALLEDADPVHKVTIIPRGQAMGATFSLPERDRYGYSMRYLAATMRVLCGGRIAEERKTEDISSGAAMDIQMVTNYARHMVLEWGMSDRLGFVRYSGEDSQDMFLSEKEYSQDTARVIDEEVKRFIDEAYSETRQILEEHWPKVEAIAEALLKYETLQGDEVNLLMEGRTLDRPTVADLLESESTKPPATSTSTDVEDRTDEAGGMLPAPA